MIDFTKAMKNNDNKDPFFESVERKKVVIENFDEENHTFEHIKLTDDQVQAYEKIKKWLDTDEKYFTLNGFSGTGKTTLINFIIQYLLSNTEMKVKCTATTNKAVKILASKIKNFKNFGTIHALLSIKAKRKGTKEYFEPVFDKYSDTKEKISDYHLVIIDECSMISKELYKYIEDQTCDYTKSSDTKVLFTGDIAQLQPVNETISCTFDYEGAILTDVVRHNDEISKKSIIVRSTNKSINPHKLLTGTDIVQTDIEDILETFKENYDEHNPDSVRMLCWTNDNVIMWNSVIREVILGRKEEKPFVEGETIVARQPCENAQQNIIFKNAEEGKVVSIEEKSTYWKLGVLKEFQSTPIFLRYIKRDYKDEYDNKLKEYAESKNWYQFWQFKKFYHDIRLSYALTCHMAQGSTFEIPIVDVADIYKNRDVEERNQLLYVAMTRASKQVKLYL